MLSYEREETSPFLVGFFLFMLCLCAFAFSWNERGLILITEVLQFCIGEYGGKEEVIESTRGGTRSRKLQEKKVSAFCKIRLRH